MLTLRSVAIRAAQLALVIVAADKIVRPLIESVLDEWDRRGKRKRKGGA